MSKELISKGSDFVIEQVDRAYGGARQTVFQVDGSTGAITQGPTKFTGKQQATATAHLIADPGNGKAIPVSTSGVCPLKSAGAETRTLAIPTFIGQRLALICDTYVGDIVITASQAVNQANNKTLTFGVATDAIELVAMTVAGALRWRVMGNDGVALSA